MPVGIPNVLEFENDLKPFRYNDMGTFLVYIIKSAFCLTLLYLPYTLLLRGEKHHRLSRMALHVLSVAAFLLPLVQEEWFGGAVRSWQTAMPEGTYAVLVERLEQADVLAMPDTGKPYPSGLWFWSACILPVWPCRWPCGCGSGCACTGLFPGDVCGKKAVRAASHCIVMPVPCRRSVGCTVLSCQKRIWMARPVMRYTSCGSRAMVQPCGLDDGDGHAVHP